MYRILLPFIIPILIGLTTGACVEPPIPPPAKASCFAHLQYETTMCMNDIDDEGCRTLATARFEICRDTRERRNVVFPLAADAVAAQKNLAEAEPEKK